MATAEVVVGLPLGAEYQRLAVREALERAVGERFNEATMDKVVRNAASSWSQSGHLAGRTFKHRHKVEPTPAVIAFAVYLAHAAGFRGEDIFTTGWLGVLDCGSQCALGLAGAAKKMGLLDLKMAGGVLELNLDRLDPLFTESRRA
jgi:hypothetical protein